MATARPGRVLEDEATALAMAQEVLRSFEEDFARRLHREGQLVRVTAALLGFTVCGALTFLGSAALPVLSIGPVKVAFGSVLGAFGGSHWAARSSELETRRQGVAKSWEVGANSLVAIAGSFPPKPTIRRLKRIVKWAHQLLARPGALSGDWRVAVFLEVACGFAPWAQRAYFERQKSTVESRSQSLRHLLPLYRFLQRSATAQVAVELCSSLAARRASSSTQDGESEGFQGPPKSSSAGTAGDADGPGDGDRDRRCLALAIVLQTITALDSLDDMTYDRLAKGLDLNKESATFCSSWMSTKRRSAAGRRQLQHILRSGRAVLRPLEIRETLTSIPPMVWGPETTTESRLFVEGGDDALQSYDNQRYERQMFYFNTHRRIAKYKHEYLEYFRCACFDCSSEAQILEHYVRVVGLTNFTDSMAAIKDVPDLSRWLHKECHRDQENPRTLFHGNPDPVERKRRIQKRQRLDPPADIGETAPPEKSDR